MRHRQQRNDQLLRERDFQQQVIEVAELYGWLAFHIPDSRRATCRGLPDTILLKPHRLLFAELKTARGKLSAEQKEWLETLKTIPTVETYVWRPSDWDSIVTVLQ